MNVCWPVLLVSLSILSTPTDVLAHVPVVLTFIMEFALQLVLLDFSVRVPLPAAFHLVLRLSTPIPVACVNLAAQLPV